MKLRPLGRESQHAFPRLEPALSECFLDHLPITNDRLDLVDDEPLNLASRNRRRRADLPTSFLRLDANVIAVMAGALDRERMAHRAVAGRAMQQASQ